MDNTYLKGIKPSPYPTSSKSEQDSVDIFHSLLDRAYIRGNVSVMDKVPNTDGILTFIDEEQYPVGQFEIQLKTLRSQHKKSPRYQCELPLLVYALDSVLPVILAVVDQEAKKVYWLHFTEELVKTLRIKSGANSVMVPLPFSQVIDGTDQNYISEWKNIIEQVKYKHHNFDQIQQQRDAFRTLLGGPNPRLLPAYSLNELAIREIHIFMDLINSKLDQEFRSIKQMRYYNYWKLAIAISKYETDELSFLILPLPLTSNSPIILEIADRSRPSLDALFNLDNAQIMMHVQDNLISQEPEKLALELVANEVFKFVGKRNFPLADRFLAEEYIYGFVQRFHSYLGLAPNPDQVNVQLVQRIIFVLVPLSRDLQVGLTTENVTYFIDHLMSKNDAAYAALRKKAEAALVDGVTSSPNLTLALRTGLFDLELLRYYLELLDGMGVKSFGRPYAEMKDLNRQGSYVWSYWDLDNIYDNASKILEQFPESYDRIVQERFPLLSTELDLFQKDSVILYILTPSYQGGKPRLLYYRFLAKDAAPLKALLVFHVDDSSCPPLISEDSYKTIWNETFEFFDIKHQLRATGELPLEIFMGSKPLHRLIDDTLGNCLDRYFKAKGLKKTDYQRFSAYE